MYPADELTAGYRDSASLRLRRLGRRRYQDALVLQSAAARRVAAGAVDELLLVEHPAIITLGRGADASQRVAGDDELAAAGISLLATDRGGGATYHGPGQLVGYPIIDLRRRGVGVRAYLRILESALVEVLRQAAVDAFLRPGLTGVWTDLGKVAAIGISVRRGITRHGFALNIDPDLDAFATVVPCGLREPVTSLRELAWGGVDRDLGGDIAAVLGQRLDAARGASRNAGWSRSLAGCLAGNRPAEASA